MMDLMHHVTPARGQARRFDAEQYLRILVSIAKADPDNGIVEYEYVKQKAADLAIDIVPLWNSTGKNIDLEQLHVPRFTALTIIRDCLLLATLDRSFSLEEKSRIYKYAGKMDIPRSDVDRLEALLEGYRRLDGEWQVLVGGEDH
jgi:hypothetical protein